MGEIYLVSIEKGQYSFREMVVVGRRMGKEVKYKSGFIYKALMLMNGTYLKQILCLQSW
jgi:hypothetical protein